MGGTTSHTVLVVDDDRDVADLYATWLEGQYAVSRAYGGHEALDALDDTVDMVVLDRRMPGSTGAPSSTRSTTGPSIRTSSW